MPDLITEFFDRVGSHDYVPQLDWADGAIRFDVRDGDHIDHWLVSIKRGVFRVSREDRPASVVVNVDREVFEHLIDGSENVYAAWLRDEVRIGGGNPQLFYAFWRFPRIVAGPPDGRHPRTLIQPRR